MGIIILVACIGSRGYTLRTFSFAVKGFIYYCILRVYISFESSIELGAIQTGHPAIILCN